MTSDQLSPQDVEYLRAEYWAMRAYDQPEEVRAAYQAREDLVGRRQSDGWRPWTRDERRLAKRYDATISDAERRLVEAYRAAMTASTTTTGASA